jgi:hypothetical protein
MEESDKKYRYDFMNIQPQDSTYFGTRRGKSRTLHGTFAPVDMRYHDPNVLRLGSAWRPEEKGKVKN